MRARVAAVFIGTSSSRHGAGKTPHRSWAFDKTPDEQAAQCGCHGTRSGRRACPGIRGGS
jgi:hypothetical protein